MQSVTDRIHYYITSILLFFSFEEKNYHTQLNTYYLLLALESFIVLTVLTMCKISATNIMSGPHLILASGVETKNYGAPQLNNKTRKIDRNLFFFVCTFKTYLRYNHT